MEITYIIVYHVKVVTDDIPALSKIVKVRIRKAIEDRLTTTPNVSGKPLRQSLRGYWKLRVDDYRVIFRIEGETIFVLAIMHRSIVYDRVSGRAEG